MSSLMSDAFFESFASSISETLSAESLPPACYTSPEFFNFEKRALFDKEWLCVGREEWVQKPGDYFVATQVGEPIIISRDRDNRLHALSAVCQHRGMQVAENCGNTRAFVCPYHHWSFGLDGTLIGAPAMESTCDFHKSSHNLPKIRLEVWQGFVFINFDNDAAPLAPRLAKVDEVIAHYPMAQLIGPKPMKKLYPWNWKVMFENNNDGYHANRLHKGPLHDIVPSSMCSFPDDLPADTAGYYRLNDSVHIDASFNPTLKAVFPVFEQLTEQERKRVVFVNIPPSLSMVIMADSILYLILDAQGAASHELTMGSLVTPQAMKDPLFKQKNEMIEAAVREIVEQDLHVDERVQYCLNSRFAPRGRYSWQEGAQRQFNLWLVDRYWKQRGIETAG